MACRHKEWDWRRGYSYLHSTFGDLVITGLVGLRPRADSLLVINPLISKEVSWFAIDNLMYHGFELAICWDQHGDRYGQGAGFLVWADGHLLANKSAVEMLIVSLPVRRQSEQS